MSAPSTRAIERLRRAGLFATRYLDCNPLKYQRSACYNPLETGATDLWNRLRYRAVAPPYGVIHVDPRRILWNLRIPPRVWPIGLILDGNWDRAFRRPVEIAFKIASMRQRFLQGVDWEDTDLFRYFYAPRFERGQDDVKGAGSIADLAEKYRREYDRLFEQMKTHGFRTPTLEHPEVTYVYVHLDRTGEPMYTLEGNHRLGMALTLELDTIPVRVVTRHAAWQRVREDVKAGARIDAAHRDHPDLQDLRAVGRRPLAAEGPS